MPRNLRSAIGCRAARAPLFGDISVGAADFLARTCRLRARALLAYPFLVLLLDSPLQPAPQIPLFRRPRYHSTKADLAPPPRSPAWLITRFCSRAICCQSLEEVFRAHGNFRDEKVIDR
eukprot:IDg1971t1